MVEFETLIAEVGLAVSAALGGLQRLGRLAEPTHDGDAAQTDGVSVPKGQTGAEGDKELKTFLQLQTKITQKNLRNRRLSSSESLCALLSR